jgi:L-seryl-tRNA(Ser) seleniumtransferase
MKARAAQWAAALSQVGIVADVREGLSTIGGGSMPGETLQTWHCAITPKPVSPSSDTAGDAASALSARLRSGLTPVVARVLRDQVLLDPRTVLPEQDATLIQTVRDAFAN